MRDGIYQVWYENTANSGSTAVILAGGRFIACDRTHDFSGTYENAFGRFSAALEIRRHSLLGERPEFPGSDVFAMHIAGLSTDEAVAGVCTYPEHPERTLNVKLVWCSEI